MSWAIMGISGRPSVCQEPGILWLGETLEFLTANFDETILYNVNEYLGDTLANMWGYFNIHLSK